DGLHVSQLVETDAVLAGDAPTREHGVGLDKMGYMESIFSESSLNAMCELRTVFDPEHRSNPGKVVPVHACKEWHAVPATRRTT
ncbi:MAG TPA: FAD-linked oxidase C-terminal domain-containing protein, partial [Gemmatimonadaceae bacterium]|nr:FAD-linked oxidase C-terminal domain-containing protein [Gemmatimonadaceae bacterium]